MKKTNIYKMDDILLFLSVVMLALVIYLSLDWITLFSGTEDIRTFLMMAPEVLGAKFYPLIMYAIAAVTAQILGRYIRFLEKKSRLILDELEISSKIRLTDLCMKLGMSQEQVKKLVIKLSRISSLGIELDGDRVIQNKKRSKVEPLKETSHESVFRGNSAESSQNIFDEKFPEDMAESFKKGELPAQFKSLLSSGSSAGKSEESEKKGPPILLLIFLFFTPLWPVAVFLIFRSSMKNMQRTNEEI